MDDTAGAAEMGVIAAEIGVMIITYLALIILMIVGCWKVYVKANQPGWGCIIPVYNVIVWLQVIGRPLWWIVLLLIPIVGIVFFVIVCLDMAKSFGKGAGYGIGIFFLPFIFLPMLGFGSARYQGPSAASTS